jgi:hypothetical protein
MIYYVYSKLLYKKIIYEMKSLAYIYYFICIIFMIYQHDTADSAVCGKKTSEYSRCKIRMQQKK